MVSELGKKMNIRVTFYGVYFLWGKKDCLKVSKETYYYRLGSLNVIIMSLVQQVRKNFQSHIFHVERT